LLQKHLGGLSGRGDVFYQEQVDLLENAGAHPGCAVLEREPDPKVKSLAIADFTDASFKEIERAAGSTNCIEVNQLG
jgi:hypothetical protein